MPHVLGNIFEFAFIMSEIMQTIFSGPCWLTFTEVTGSFYKQHLQLVHVEHVLCIRYFGILSYL